MPSGAQLYPIDVKFVFAETYSTFWDWSLNTLGIGHIQHIDKPRHIIIQKLNILGLVIHSIQINL